MRILYVDTENVCNSASCEALMLTGARAMGLRGFEILSAGSKIPSGSKTCSHAPALRGVPHSARSLSHELIQGADLILVSTRKDLAAITKKDQAARKKAFTTRQAGRWSAWMIEKQFVPAARARALRPEDWRDEFPSRLTRDVAPMPSDPNALVQWAVGELDAARGVAPAGYPKRKPSLRHNRKLGPLRKVMPRRKHKPPSGPHPDDLLNPDADEISHEEVYQQMVLSTQSLLQFLSSAGIGRT